jgi:hypothetical protein
VEQSLVRAKFPNIVIPAEAKRRAGIQEPPRWMPAFAGMTILSSCPKGEMG